MCNINSDQYLLLKKLYKSKDDTIYLDPSNRDYEFLLHNELIESEYDADGPILILEPNGNTRITNKGISKYHSYRLESRRHWQNIFIPKTLNVIVSIITTLITYFILELLQG